jgi:FkbM family methyltransferase
MSTTELIRRMIPRPIRNTLRRPRAAAWRTLAKLRFAFGGRKVVQVRSDWAVKCHPICEPEFAVFQNDPEQKRELEDFVSRCAPAMRLLDVGAHWGFFSLAAVRYGGPNANVVAVEASPAAAQVLQHNLVANSAAQVRIVNSAAGERTASVEMLTTGAGGADYYVVPATPRPDTTTVQQIALDDLCRNSHFAPTHLKVDVEGYEEEVLRGAEWILESFKPTVFLELHGPLILKRGHAPEPVIEILSRKGYVFNAGGRAISLQAIADLGFNMRLVATPNHKP